MLQCGAVCCSVLHRVAVCCIVLQYVAVCGSMWQCAIVCCSVLHCVAVCSSMYTHHECVLQAKAAAREKREFHDVKANRAQIWEAQQSMCEVMAMTEAQRRIGMRCR